MSTTKPKNLSELKRMLNPGVQVKRVYRRLQPHPEPVLCTVIKRQANAVAFAVDGATQPSWIEWPKSADVLIEDNGFAIVYNGVVGLRYEWA